MQSDEEDNGAECKDVMVKLTDPTYFPLDSLDARILMVVSQVGLGSFLHSLVGWFGVLLNYYELTLPKFSLSTDGLSAIVLNVCCPNKIEEKIWKVFEDFDKENVCFISLFIYF